MATTCAAAGPWWRHILRLDQGLTRLGNSLYLQLMSRFWRSWSLGTGLISNCPPLRPSLHRHNGPQPVRRHPAATDSSRTGVPPGRGRPPAQPRWVGSSANPATSIRAEPSEQVDCTGGRALCSIALRPGSGTARQQEPPHQSVAGRHSWFRARSAERDAAHARRRQSRWPRYFLPQTPDLPGAMIELGSRASLMASWNFSSAPSPQL